MRRFINLAAIASEALSIGLVSCNSEKTNADQSANYYNMDMVQPNTAVVLWNPADYDFEEGNKFYLENFAKMARVTHAAKSVWYFKHFMADKSLWYTENAIPIAYGKDAQGWYYMDGDKRVACDGAQAAQVGYWNAAMEGYWARYEAQFGKLSDPHVKENKFWETSHSVVYDLKAKKGYVMPFENFYSKDGKPIEFSFPE